MTRTQRYDVHDCLDVPSSRPLPAELAHLEPDPPAGGWPVHAAPAADFAALASIGGRPTQYRIQSIWCRLFPGSRFCR